MMVTYDPDADALYVSFEPRGAGDVVRTVELGDGRQVDYGAEDLLLGVEFLGVSQGVNLTDVPRVEDVRAAPASLPKVA